MQYDRFGDPIVSEEVGINGFEKIELASFIEKNNARYLEIFRKNEGRKFFLNMNWAAMFLSIYWMFYRKMFLEGFLFLVVVFIFSTTIFSVSITALKDDILAVKEFKNNTNFNASEIAANEIKNKSADYIENLYKYNKMKNSLNLKLFAYIVLPFFIFSLAFGLIADCLYRRYIFRKIKFTTGGVSKIAILAALGLMNVYNAIMSNIQPVIISLLIK